MKVLNPDPGACIRCGGTATERLDFSSSEAESRVFLCKQCFVQARAILNGYILRRDLEVTIR